MEEGGEIKPFNTNSTPNVGNQVNTGSEVPPISSFDPMQMSEERLKSNYLNTSGLSSSGVKVNPRDLATKSQSDYSDIM